ncbi:MAG: FlgO family outer membrane protein [Methylococcales bacterium]|nr:FlgO family outer membrane protein [Methylococcales bacterium]
MFKKQLLVLAVILIMLSGCSRFFYRQAETEDGNLVELSYNGVSQLLLNLRQPLPKGSVVVINSLINVDDLGQTLAFGRIVSDQLTSAFQHEGYIVTGMDLPIEMFVKNDAGILQIPEKTLAALNNIDAKAVIIGSYAPGRNTIYVSLRVVDIASQTVISSTDYGVPMGPDAKAMTLPPLPVTPPPPPPPPKP